MDSDDKLLKISLIIGGVIGVTGILTHGVTTAIETLNKC